jgi:hypothetical protein
VPIAVSGWRAWSESSGSQLVFSIPGFLLSALNAGLADFAYQEACHACWQKQGRAIDHDMSWMSGRRLNEV